VERGGLRAEFGSSGFAGDAVAEGARRVRSFLLRAFGSRRRDAIAMTLAVGAGAAVMINALYLQPGPHPAPMFTIKPRLASAASVTGAVRVARSRPGEPGRGESGGRTQADLIAAIQRELERRGFYDGPIDGFHGPRTDAAIRDFAQAAGLKAAVEPSEELLQSIVRSPARAAPGVQHTVQAPAPTRGDAIGDLIAGSSRRVLAVQRALGDFGYGPVRPTGVFGPETRAAVEKFERDRKLPATGQISDQLVRELAAVTGRPLE
jgi:peptidoglycan hydrolase-like protein with peptidoglycan-binding domain